MTLPFLMQCPFTARGTLHVNAALTNVTASVSTTAHPLVIALLILVLTASSFLIIHQIPVAAAVHLLILAAFLCAAIFTFAPDHRPQQPGGPVRFQWRGQVYQYQQYPYGRVHASCQLSAACDL
jgi:hypothetical protein